jgi:hypothetical protein
MIAIGFYIIKKGIHYIIPCYYLFTKFQLNIRDHKNRIKMDHFAYGFRMEPEQPN